MIRLSLLVIALAAGTCLASPEAGRKLARVTVPPRLPAASRSVNTMGDVRVMSFNIRVRTVADIFGNNWGLRRGLVAKTIRDFGPDLLGTQEGLASQLDYLRKELPGYGFVGVGRDDGRRDGEMCGIFYKTSRFTKLAEGHFWLSETPSRPGTRAWGAWFPRMVSWVKLRPISGGQEFYFFNTHLDAFSEEARVEGAKLLRERISRIAGSSPVIVTGDFNTGEETTAYDILTARRSGRGGTKLVDTLRATDPMPRENEGTRHGFRGDRDGERIDWILACTQFKPIDADIVHARRGNRYPSDHFPVTAILRPAHATVAANAARRSFQ